MNKPKKRAYIVAWSELARWDIKSARAAAFRSTHPHFVKMGEFVEEATELAHPMRSPEHNWPVYGVSNRNGIRLSHYQKGSEFNAPYKRIKKDWFFHNPTRANVGSLGRVPDVPDDAITSPEYQVWRIKRGLLPEFVELLIRLPFFLELVESHRVGAVKERLFVQNLCEIPIPALNTEAQKSIVRRWNEGKKRAEEKALKARELEQLVDAEFFAQLGLKKPGRASISRAFSVLWQDFARWGVDYNFLNKSGADLSQGTYPAVELGKVLEIVQYGTSQKAQEFGDGVPVVRMNNIVDGRLDFSDLKFISLPYSELKKLLLRRGDILFNRTNSKELVGKCAVFDSEADFVFASYLIRLRIREGAADPDYIAYAINSAIGRFQIDALSRQIIGQANINTEELRGLRIPMPPLAIQKRLATRIFSERERSMDLQVEARRDEENLRRDINNIILHGNYTVGGGDGGN